MSLKKNFIYSSILTVSKYLFPLIVYPYVSRTLGLSNIGIVNFIDNLINYFMFISMMGISTVGVREIAAVRDHKEQLSKTFASLLTLTIITTVIAIVVLWIAMYTVPKLMPYQDLLYVGIVKLTFNLFLMEWFFMGVEDFRYITNRSLFVKCLYVVSVFLFVREAADYKIYYIISVCAVVANALFNIVYIRKFIRWDFHHVDLKPYYRAFLIFGVYVLLSNVYISLNPVWLGFVRDTDEVGCFTTAFRLHNILMAVLLSFTNILFPRVSNLLAEGKKEEFWEKITTAFDAIFLFSFPTIMFMLVAGPELLHIVVGDGFEGAYLPLRIITPLVLVIGIEQILVIQILMSMHCDNTVLKNSFIGAIVALGLNIVLTPQMGANGSAIVWVFSECAIMVLSIAAIYRKFGYLPPYQRIFAYLGSYVPLLVLSIVVYQFLDDSFATVACIGTLTVLYAAINEIYVMKNKVVGQLLHSLHR